MIDSSTPYKLAEIIRDTWPQLYKKESSYTMKYESKNEKRHKNYTSLYAHYSMIDEYNYDKFPLLKFTNPIHFKLNAGESLYIPKKWWHWVKTTKKTFAVNYWFNNKIESFPFLFNHTIDYDINLLNDEMVDIWDSKSNNSYKDNFKKFYNSKCDNRCLITLENYEMGINNQHVKNKLKEYINFPIEKKLVVENNYDYNVWISSNIHDTGLHFDDEDGVLTVIDGEKDILLFPPSDTKYLYPYSISYEWNQKPAIKCKYNSFEIENKVNGISSGELLYITCNNNKRVLSNITKIYEQNNDEMLIWGFKKEKEIYRWEIYRYTLSNKIVITSRDIYSNYYDLPNSVHYYLKLDDSIHSKLPFWGYGKCKIDNVLHDESKIFVVDNYKSFCENYSDYMVKLNYESIAEKFKDIILNKYNCYQLSIFNKSDNEIFVMYMGLTNEEFINFLLENNYAKYIIDFVSSQMKSNNYHINNEIAIVYDIKTKNVIRTGFYGNL